jgi:hypothetical protein
MGSTGSVLVLMLAAGGVRWWVIMIVAIAAPRRMCWGVGRRRRGEVLGVLVLAVLGGQATQVVRAVRDWARKPRPVALHSASVFLPAPGVAVVVAIVRVV